MKASRKILHISVSYNMGGAGIAATSLYESLITYSKEPNYEFAFLCSISADPLSEKEVTLGVLTPEYDPSSPPKSKSNNVNVPKLENAFIKKIKNSKFGFFLKDMKRKHITKDSNVRYGALYNHDFDHTDPRLLDAIITFNPDIIHLHYNIGMFSAELLQKIQLQTKASIVWTTHDMWAYTGGCHYHILPTLNTHYTLCDRWKKTCGKCPLLYDNILEDRSFATMQDKLKYYPNLDISLVSPAAWAANHMQQSPLFATKPIFHIPNAYDTEVFKPYDKEDGMSLFNLPSDKTLLLVGNFNSTLKGRDLLITALKKLRPSTKKKIVLVTFGENLEIEFPKLPVINLGAILDRESLAKLYSTCSVMIVPSVIDIGPSTAIEAMLCGTPVVAFDAYGPSEFISHKKNGYLAKAYSTSSLRDGIEFLISYKNYQELSSNARDAAYVIFNREHIANQYWKVYHNIIDHQLS